MPLPRPSARPTTPPGQRCSGVGPSSPSRYSVSSSSMTTPSSRARGYYVNGSDAVVLHRLPAEVLLTIFTLVLDHADSLGPIVTLSLVCRRWRDLLRHDHVWSYVARHYLVAFPLLRQLFPPRPTSPSAVTQDLRFPMDGGRVMHRRLASGELRRPTRHAVMSSRTQVRKYLEQREHAHRVAERRRYVLHLFVSFALLCVTLSLVCFIVPWEMEPAPEECTSVTTSDILVSAVLGRSPRCSFAGTIRNSFTVANGFKFLWATFALVVAAIIANIVMQAHFEPRPLVQRLERHRDLIVASVGVLSAALIAGALPLALFQIWTGQEPRERGSVWRLAAPTCAAGVIWQIHVLARFRRQIAAVLARRQAVHLRDAYDACANSTPLFFSVSLLAGCAYHETGSQWAVAVGCLVPFVACVVLSALFLVDFVSGAKLMDGLASLSLAVAAGTPGMALCGVIRGATLLPLALASAAFYVGHAERLFALMTTVDELEVLVATGRSTADES
jgi:hypothetical protein